MPLVTCGAIGPTTPTGTDPWPSVTAGWIHPDFRHGLSVIGTTPCELVNIVVPTRVIQVLAERYAKWHWGSATVAGRRHFDAATLQSLDHWPERLLQDDQDPLVRDARLLAIQAASDRPSNPSCRPGSMRHWRCSSIHHISAAGLLPWSP